MQSMLGTITIVQEGRFQLMDDAGVSHHFLLEYRAAIDPEQLPSLLYRRVQVDYADPTNLIGHAAREIRLLEHE